jgi:hypothetical protein
MADETRVPHPNLDLRRPELQENLVLRHRLLPSPPLQSSRLPPPIPPAQMSSRLPQPIPPARMRPLSMPL